MNYFSILVLMLLLVLHHVAMVLGRDMAKNCGACVNLGRCGAQLEVVGALTKYSIASPNPIFRKHAVRAITDIGTALAENCDFYGILMEEDDGKRTI